MPRIAFMTIGVLKEPMGHPDVQGFVDRIPGVFESAESCPGFVDRSRRSPVDGGAHSWGEFAVPAYFDSVGDILRVPATLSLWEDLESVAAYAYRGAHGEAMTKRAEWFLPDHGPGYVAWWVEDGQLPSFHDACERWTSLHEHGPTPFAFDFKRPFDANGAECMLDRTRVKEIGGQVS